MTSQPRSPQAMYRAEKERAQRERSLNHAELMAEAQRAFDKMMEDGKAARKGGRPKGSTNRPTTPAVPAAAPAAAPVPEAAPAKAAPAAAS
ncbi:MAG TPA: hypothetical protein VFY16_00475, partial [Gemmatimonadaceae bacterium]|nr:hypothetical protein [Gemmatimonadaceae bacterium]